MGLKKNKVFCIGYPRTGTVSQTKALSQLGFKSWHFGRKYYNETFHALKTGQFDKNVLSKFDAFADVPIFFIYKELDKQWPDSKFVLITREKNSWFGSMTHVMKLAKRRHKNNNKVNEFLWSNMYPEMIEEHTDKVKKYFSNRNDLFIKGIKEVDYDSLASFLGVKTNKKGFPHLHRR